MDGRCGDRRWGVSVLAVLWPGRGILRGEINTKKTVVKKVKEKLAEGGGDLRSVLRQWNEGMFAERGVQASLEPPTESGGVVVDQWPGASRKDMERAKERMKKRFRIVQVPFDPRIHELGPSRVQLSPVLPLSQSQSSVRRSPSESHPTESSEGRRSQYLDEQEDAEEAPQLPPRKPGLGMNELASDQGVFELASERTPVVLYELDGHSSEIQGNNYAGNDILSLKE